MTAYKSLNCLAPNYWSSKFILHSDIFNSYNLRDSENRAVSAIVGSAKKEILGRVVQSWVKITQG